MPAVGARVVRLARCVGCGELSRAERLGGPEDDACPQCLTGLGRGPKWLEVARRIRSDPAFARQVYSEIPDSWRDHYHRAFGGPPPAEE